MINIQHLDAYLIVTANQKTKYNIAPKQKTHKQYCNLRADLAAAFCIDIFLKTIFKNRSLVVKSWSNNVILYGSYLLSVFEKKMILLPPPPEVEIHKSNPDFWYFLRRKGKKKGLFMKEVAKTRSVPSFNEKVRASDLF